MDGQILLRVEEAAKRLGFGRSKVYEMAASGELPVVRFGRSVRIPAAELERWVAGKVERGATSEAA
ncbi:helix-turn-helix domain-containing protein [Vulgatibacter sp.]|uniref:helix-turn-helix domain-containing protein n=1 Tax=Vulgatibacter sp. TaxID=1971226 RepID=UPI00356ADA50